MLLKAVVDFVAFDSRTEQEYQVFKGDILKLEYKDEDQFEFSPDGSDIIYYATEYWDVFCDMYEGDKEPPVNEAQFKPKPDVSSIKWDDDELLI